MALGRALGKEDEIPLQAFHGVFGSWIGVPFDKDWLKEVERPLRAESA